MDIPTYFSKVNTLNLFPSASTIFVFQMENTKKILIYHSDIGCKTISPFFLVFQNDIKMKKKHTFEYRTISFLKSVKAVTFIVRKIDF